MKHVFLAVGLALAATAAHAQAEQAMLLGSGAMTGSCGLLVQYGRDSSYGTWVLGYISGANVWSPSFSNITKSMPNVSVLQWVENWCRAHPLAFPRLTDAYRAEARQRAQGATLAELARSYNVSRSAIPRLTA